MQISSNTTGMEAGLTVATDKDARDHCVVVVKGTFDTDAWGNMTLAAEQQPMVYADEHYDDPETTPIRYESDFAPEKPLAEVIVVGKAVPPGGQPARQVMVQLEVEGRKKAATVVGDRRWTATGPSLAVPFSELPLTFDRAFGGQDDTRGEGKVAVEHRNLAGVGFSPYRPAEAFSGRPLPNVEDPQRPMTSPRDRPAPMGFGVLGRAWKQRVDFAGTYDKHWLDEVCPFLPADFDARYFMSTQTDQWFPSFRGGELIRCTHMAQAALVAYRLPAISMPVSFRFVDRAVERKAVLDTVIVEPHLGRAMLLWRTSVPVDKKLTHLREVFVGAPPPAHDDGLLGYRNGKPHFRDLGAALRWAKKQKQGPS